MGDLPVFWKRFSAGLLFSGLITCGLAKGWTASPSNCASKYGLGPGGEVLGKEQGNWLLVGKVVGLLIVAGAGGGWNATVCGWNCPAGGYKNIFRVSQ